MPSATQREDIAHLLAAVHLELQKQDGGGATGTHHNITNSNYELFVER